MVRARLPFTKKFQPKFSVFSCANTHSATKTQNSLDREMWKAFALHTWAYSEHRFIRYEAWMYFFETDGEWSVKLGSVWSVSPSPPPASRSSLLSTIIRPPLISVMKADHIGSSWSSWSSGIILGHLVPFFLPWSLSVISRPMIILIIQIVLIVIIIYFLLLLLVSVLLLGWSFKHLPQRMASPETIRTCLFLDSFNQLAIWAQLRNV